MAPATGQFSILINGLRVAVSDMPSQTTLLDFVRSRGLTGAKEGCAEGECGACAVLVPVQSGQGITLRAVNSCLIPLPAMADSEVYTVESLASNGQLAQVQQAMMEYGGSQCGYCTPGFAVSMFAEKVRSPQRALTVETLAGNLCRCTGYRPILAALGSVECEPAHTFRQRLREPAPMLRELHYDGASSRFSRPGSLLQCAVLKAADPDACFVAGNTDLGVVANLRHKSYRHLISLQCVPELLEFSDGDRFVELGAGLTLSDIEDLWIDRPEVVSEWLPLFASPLIRNRATLAGNLMTASPIGDAAPLLMALNAEIRLTSAAAERRIAVSDFFASYRRTVALGSEVLRSVLVPKPFPALARFYKVSKRRLDDISTVSACFSINHDASGLLRDVRLAYGGVAETPLRIPAAEQILEGTLGGDRDWDRAKEAVRRALTPIGDQRGSAAYRLAIAESLLAKFRLESQR